MSLRYFPNINKLLVLPALMCSIGAGGVAFASVATSQPSVQNLADQAVPTPPPAPMEYYDSPLAAGTLTLQDVLEAHKPATSQVSKLPALGGTPTATATAPLMVPPIQSSTTSLMMSQGMKAVLQKVGSTTVAPIQVNAPVVAAQPQSLLQGQPASLAQQGTVANAAPDVTYQPGQAPRNLATALASTVPPATSVAVIPQASPVVMSPALQEASAVPAPASSSASSCDQKVQKWEKGCNEAGYPASYVGKIVGETRTGCADGVLHDVWVTNTCSPPDAASSQTAKTDGACGSASNNDFEKIPTDNLCAQGIASAVSGSGPWTWACSGVNGGAAAACTAVLHVAVSQGACGEANGVAVASAPSSDLCKSGTASNVNGSGPWTWMCKGAGKGHSESCIAPALAKPATFMAPVPAKEERTAPAPVLAAAEKTAPTPVAAPESFMAAQSAVPSEKGELCGTAAETLAYEAPEHDLCRAGTSSVVNGDGPWTWSCTNNEGVTSSCRTLSLNGEAPAASAAPKAEAEVPAAVSSPDASSPRLQAPNTLVPPTQTTQELACGLAASQSAIQAPSQDLCLGGKASVVRGKGPWHWTCGSKKHKVSCETPSVLDGVCGSANGALLKSAPFAGLCSSGKPSGIEGNGPWSWTCSGSGGGVEVSCAASVQETPVSAPAPVAAPVPASAKTAGLCGASDNATLKETPTEGLCASGVPSVVSGEGPWSWSCSGTNGGDVSSCSANKLSPPKPAAPRTNGQCGSSNGETTVSLPVSGLCSKGVASTVVGDGPWNWSCAGENGGMTVSCTAPLEPPAPIDGICGSVSGVPTRIKPQSGLCSSGIIGVVNGKGPWTWACSGANGGAAASCVAPVSGKKGSAPVLVNPDANTETAAPEPAPVVAPSGLVTPHLVPSKAFAPAPAPSQVPAAANVSEGNVPASPGLTPTNEPVQPPSLRDSLPSAAVLQEGDAGGAAKSSAEHLSLDPTMSTVLFSHGSTTIEDNVLTTLDKLASALQAAPDMRITLVAYADNGNTTPRDARRLSLTRALAVRGYLSSKGISESRVDVRAEGANTTSGYLDRVDVKVND